MSSFVQDKDDTMVSHKSKDYLEGIAKHKLKLTPLNLHQFETLLKRKQSQIVFPILQDYHTTEYITNQELCELSNEMVDSIEHKDNESVANFINSVFNQHSINHSSSSQCENLTDETQLLLKHNCQNFRLTNKFANLHLSQQQMKIAYFIQQIQKNSKYKVYPSKKESEKRKAEMIKKAEIAKFLSEQENNHKGEDLKSTLPFLNSKRLYKSHTNINDLTKVQKLPQNTIYQIGHLSFQPESSYRPEVREHCSFQVMDGIAYLYGGLGSKIFSNMFKFNCNLLQWEQINYTAEQPNLGRYGHVAEVYNRSVVIFGGERNEKGQIQKTVMQDIRVYNIDKKELKFARNSGEIIEPKTNHASTVLGKFLIVHGGINNRNQIVKELLYCDLSVYNWSKAAVAPNQEVDDLMKFGVYNHQIQAVYQSERKNPTLYRIEPMEAKLISMQKEGLYLFGGIDSQNQSHNNLIWINCFERPMRQEILNTRGKTPEARYGHQMKWIPMINSLVVNGGKNVQDIYLSDIYLLKLDSLTWVELKIYGQTMAQRAFHASFVWESKFYIFGGINYDGYVSALVDIIETDELKAKDKCGDIFAKKNDVESPKKGKKNPNQDKNDEMKSRMEKVKFDQSKSVVKMPINLPTIGNRQKSYRSLLQSSQKLLSEQNQQNS